MRAKTWDLKTKIYNVIVVSMQHY